MSHFLHTFEWVVDVTIPYIFIIISLLLLSDFVFDLRPYLFWVHVIDSVVVLFFVFDLFFKCNHVRNARMFVKLYWLDILAVFPFYLLFRSYALLSGILVVGEEVGVGQRLAHEAVLLRETEVLLREQRVARGIKFVQRLIRAIAARIKLTRHTMQERSAELQRSD